MRRLLAANLLLAALIGAHIADHVVRQHTTATAALGVPGVLGAIIVVVSLALTAVRHPRAPLVAVAVGVLTAAGFVAIHLVPHWSVFSDPYPDRHLDAVSWLSMLAALVAGGLLAAAGLAELGGGRRALRGTRAARRPA